MKKQELEHRLAEANDVRTTIEKTLSLVQEDIKKAEGGTGEALRVLGEVHSFVRDALGTLSGMQQEEALKFVESNLQKLKGWSQSEVERLKSRPQLLQERAAAFQSILSWLDERSKSHESRISAIDRAADPNRDKRHPEKLSVKRAAAMAQSEIEEDSE
jgi:hypothetical protein